MNTVFLVRGVTTFVRKHATTILTTCGIVGLGVSCFLSAKAGANIEFAMRDAKIKERYNKPLTFGQKAKIVTKELAAPTVSAVLTGLCIARSHTISKRNEAKLIAAYAVATKSFQAYREKVDAVYGKGSDKKIRNELIKDSYVKSNIEPMNDGQTELFYLEIPGGDEFNALIGAPQESRFFETTMENVQNAFYHFNRNFVLRSFAVLNELYDFLGIPETEFGNTVGYEESVGESKYGYKFIDYFISDEELELDGPEKLTCKVIHLLQDPTTDCVEAYI